MSGTVNLGLRFRALPGVFDSLVLRLYADADHANDAFNEKSTSGVFVQLFAEETVLPLGWAAKGLGPTARSTPEAELYALDFATHSFGIPATLLWSALLCRVLPIIAMEDNEPLIQAVNRGLSRKLCYVSAKSERIALSVLHETYVGDPDDLEISTPHRLTKVASENQNVDFFTKPLDSLDHWSNAWRVGLMPLALELLVAADP